MLQYDKIQEIIKYDFTQEIINKNNPKLLIHIKYQSGHEIWE